MGYPIQIGAATGVSQRAFLSPISDARHQQQCGDRSPVCTSDSRRYTLSRNSHVDAIARDYPPPRERERVGYTYYDDEEPWAHLYAEAAFLSAKRASMVREGERIRHEAEESVIQMAADASVHKGSVVTSATFDRLLSPQPRLSPSARSHSRAKTAECPTDGSACGAAALYLENGAGSPASPLAINAVPNISSGCSENVSPNRDSPPLGGGSSGNIGGASTPIDPTVGSALFGKLGASPVVSSAARRPSPGNQAARRGGTQSPSATPSDRCTYSTPQRLAGLDTKRRANSVRRNRTPRAVSPSPSSPVRRRQVQAAFVDVVSAERRIDSSPPSPVSGAGSAVLACSQKT